MCLDAEGSALSFLVKKGLVLKGLSPQGLGSENFSQKTCKREGKVL